MKLNFDPYETLGVASNATADEIHAAYRTRARKYHPDAGGDPWAFRRIKEAYDYLRLEIPAATTGNDAATPASQSASEPIAATGHGAGALSNLIAAGMVLGFMIGGIVGWLFGVNPWLAALVGLIPGAIVANSARDSR